MPDKSCKQAAKRPLTPAQQRAWLSYMQVYHRLEYEMNRQLQSECGLSLGDYTVMNALSHVPRHRLQLTSLAVAVGWELSRLSHHLRRMEKRGLVEWVASALDGRATDAVLTSHGWKALQQAAPRHVESVRRLVFSDLTTTEVAELADILSEIYDTIIREGTLPRPELPPPAA